VPGRRRHHAAASLLQTDEPSFKSVVGRRAVNLYADGNANVNSAADETCRSVTDLASVRCCKDNNPGVSLCPVGTLAYTDTEFPSNVAGASGVTGVDDATLSQAEDGCAAHGSGYRLCTADELTQTGSNGGAKGTGCSHDRRWVWSSSTCTMAVSYTGDADESSCPLPVPADCAHAKLYHVTSDTGDFNDLKECTETPLSHDVDACDSDSGDSCDVCADELEYQLSSLPSQYVGDYTTRSTVTLTPEDHGSSVLYKTYHGDNTPKSWLPPNLWKYEAMRALSNDQKIYEVFLISDETYPEAVIRNFLCAGAYLNTCFFKKLVAAEPQAIRGVRGSLV
jgi:hypothetical protein